MTGPRIITAVTNVHSISKKGITNIDLLQSLIFIILFLRPILIKFKEHSISKAGGALHGNQLLSGLVILIGVIIWLRSRSSPNQLIFMAYLVLSAVSILWAPVKYLAMIELIKATSFVAMFIITYQVCSVRLIKIDTIILISAIVPFMYAFYQYAVGDFHYFYEGWRQTNVSARAIASFFAHPNALGTYSVAIYALLLARLLQVQQKVYVFWLLCSATIIWLSGARIALVGGGIVTLVQLAMYNKRFRLLGVIFSPVMGVAVVLLIEYLCAHGKGLSSLLWRFHTWEELIKTFNFETLLYGHGLGYISYYFKVLMRSFVTQSHNDYLKLVAEIGVTGMFLYYYLVFKGMWIGARKMFHVKLDKKSARERIILSSVVSLSVAVFCMSITENIYKELTFQWLFWALSGASLSIFREEVTV